MYDIVLTINGQQVNFVNIIERFNSSIDEFVVTEAKAVLEERVKMNRTLRRLAELDYEINTELRKLFPEAIVDEDND